MNLLNIKKLAAALAVACSLALASSASAVTVGDQYYLGFINPGTPAGDAATESYVQTLIDLAPGTTSGVAPGANNANYFVRSANVFVDLPDADYGIKQDNGNTTIDVTGWTYLLGKYGSGQNSEGSHVWYVAGLSGVIDIQATVGGNALSHSTLLTRGGTSVPDGGTTAALLGLSLVAMSFFARRKL